MLPGPSLGTTVLQASTSGDYAGDLDTPGVNHVALVAPPTPGTDVTKDAEHSWAGTKEGRAKE